MTLIVVEGVDGAGKSTLISKLPHTRELHCGPIKKSPMQEYVEPLMDYDGSYDMVCDRLHIGELVYGPIYRGESTLTEGGRRFVEMFLESRGALKLILDAPLDEIQRRLEHRGEDFLRPEDLERVWRFYRLYGSDNGWLVLDRPDADVLHSLALGAEALARPLFAFPTYVGSRYPDVLFVVDTFSNPALRADPESAGDLFFTSLPDGIRCGVVSTRDPNSDIWHLWNTLMYPRVIALGRKAMDAALAAKLPCTSQIPHPEEILRQAPSSAPRYGEIITKGVIRG
jgi:hypothetical protein